MKELVLECEENAAYDVYKVNNGSYMYAADYAHAVSMMQEDPIKQLLDIKTRMEIKEKRWKECTDENLIETRLDKLRYSQASYYAARSICSLVYGEQTIKNVLAIF